MEPGTADINGGDEKAEQQKAAQQKTVQVKLPQESEVERKRRGYSREFSGLMKRFNGGMPEIEPADGVFNTEMPEIIEEGDGIFASSGTEKEAFIITPRCWRWGTLGIILFVAMITFIAVAVRKQDSDNEPTVTVETMVIGSAGVGPSSAPTTNSWPTSSPVVQVITATATPTVIKATEAPIATPTSVPTPTPAPTPPPPPIPSIPILLEGKDRFMNYIVQWGIETYGCGEVAWPELELSCGEGFDSAVHVLGYDIPDKYNDMASDKRPLVECQRTTDDLINCNVQNVKAQDSVKDDSSSSSSSLNSSSLLYATMLVVCGGDSSKTAESLARQMHLRARIPLSTYAKECTQELSSSKQESNNETETAYGGFSMPWLSVGLMCVSDKKENNRHLRRGGGGGGGGGGIGQATRRIPYQPDHTRRAEATIQGIHDGNFQDRIDVHSKLFCEQGDRTQESHNSTIDDQFFCTQRGHCVTYEACDGAGGDDGATTTCTGSTECEIPSELIMADSVELSDSDSAEANPDSCIFPYLLPHDWMWALAARRMDQTPTLNRNLDRAL
ncbi:hypothetical protein ACA910_009029 [Epithemia clementina (nom. ined.)]